MSILENVQPKNVFHYFEEICQIPHGSYHTKQISDYLAAFAKEHELEYYQDDLNNVVMIKEATAGYEAASPVILQGHMDMVCEKDAGVEIDFEKDGLDIYIDGDFIKAKGTTLGGDDGIAVAYALAVLADDSLEHPRLEAVITVDEEVGLLGAKDIDLSMLKGHILLNIDSEEEGHFLTSCAGGLSTQTKIPVVYQTEQGIKVSLHLHQLEGGHSGAEIDKERANGIIEMGRILKYLEERMQIGLISLEGGLKDNAIPRNVSSSIMILPEDREAFSSYIAEITEILKKEYAISDPNLTLDVQFDKEGSYEVLNPSSLQKVLFYLRNVPNGVMHMSTNIKGLVETSLNAGIMKLNKEELYISTSVRSSVKSRKEELTDRLVYLTEFLGGEISIEGDYPAWEYCADSRLREKVSEVYTRIFQKEPVFEAIHAGLECGMFADKIADLDAVSFGPDMFDIHTPKERLSISSTERVYKFIVEFLRSMK